MQKPLKKYSDSCFESLSCNFQNVTYRCSRGAVHRLRLNIKRLWALINILEIQDNTLKSNKAIRKIDYVFNISGNLRDLQVETLILKSFKKKKIKGVDQLNGIFNNQKKRLKKQLIGEIAKINSFDFILTNQKLNETIETLNNNDIKNHYTLYLQELNHQLINAKIDNIDINSLHRIRTLIKDIIYSIALLKKCKQKVSLEASAIDLLNKTQQELGMWHDLSVLQKKIVSLNIKNKYDSLIRIVDDRINIQLIELFNSFKKLTDINYPQKKEGVETPS